MKVSDVVVGGTGGMTDPTLSPPSFCEFAMGPKAAAGPLSVFAAGIGSAATALAVAELKDGFTESSIAGNGMGRLADFPVVEVAGETWLD